MLEGNKGGPKFRSVCYHEITRAANRAKSATTTKKYNMNTKKEAIELMEMKGVFVSNEGSFFGYLDF